MDNIFKQAKAHLFGRLNAFKYVCLTIHLMKYNGQQAILSGYY